MNNQYEAQARTMAALRRWVVVVAAVLAPSCASVRVVEEVTSGTYCTSNAPRDHAPPPEVPAAHVQALATQLQVPADVVETARVIGAFGALAVAADEHGEPAARLRAREDVLHRIALASLDVHSTMALLDCEADRARTTATALSDAERERVDGITLAALGIGGVAAVVSGAIVELVDDEQAIAVAGVVGLAGGVTEGALSIAALTVSERAVFQHPINPLAELTLAASHQSFPEAVWFALVTDVNGVSGRTRLRDGWRVAGLLGDEDVADAVLLGTGGTYDATLLGRRATMLHDVRMAVSLTLQDLEHLTRTVLAIHAP